MLNFDSKILHIHLDAAATTASGELSFYKGVPVVKNNNGIKMSFGVIFLSNDAFDYNLNHERGHNTQLMMLGPVKYGLGIGAPSLTTNLNYKGDYYHSFPWERTAEMFGGVNNRLIKGQPAVYKNGSKVYSVLYLIALLLA